MKEVSLKRFFKTVFANQKGIISTPGKDGSGGGLVISHTTLTAKLFDNKGNFIDERIVHDKVVTNVFVNDLVDALQGSAIPYGTFDDYKYHWSGTSTEGEGVTDTTLDGGCTNGLSAGTQYEAGTQIEGTSSNIYKSVATRTYSVSSTDGLDISEHGLFNSTSSTSGTLMDRTVFTSLLVKNGWKIEFTFTIEFTAGG